MSQPDKQDRFSSRKRKAQALPTRSVSFREDAPRSNAEMVPNLV